MRPFKQVLLGGLAGLGLAVAAGAWPWWPASDVEPAVTLAGPSRGGPEAASVMAFPAQAEADAAAALGELAALAASAASGSVAAGLAQTRPLAALRALKQCYYADNCGFGGADSRAGLEAHFKASQAIALQLKALSGAGSEMGEREQAALAREFLGFPDGHVQAEALALAARLPPDPSTVNAAVAALADSYDSVLFKKAFPVLQQWQSQGMRSGYDEMLVSVVHTGGWHAAQAVAENLAPFLNEANVAQFEAVAAQLEPGARQTALRQSIRDYRLLRSGG
jgi:hypothetical protein